jgi:hypothetical protein
MKEPPEGPPIRELQQFIACGYYDGHGLADDDTPLIAITRAGDEVIETDSDGDEWRVVIAWNQVEGRLLPTTMVLSSESGKALSPAVLRSIDIRAVIDTSRNREVQADSDRLALAERLKRSGVKVAMSEPLPFDAPRKPGRKPHPPEYYERIAALWLASDDDQNRARSVAARMWEEQGNTIPDNDAPEHEQALWVSFRVQIRKAIRECRKRGLLPEKGEG